jgi:hypothetical protein
MQNTPTTNYDPASCLAARATPKLDEAGRPLPALSRQSFIDLRGWLDNDEAILGFLFPDGLPRDDEQLRADLAMVRRQPWSPQSAIDAMLKGWPKKEKEREFTLEAADRRLRKVRSWTQAAGQ